MCNFLVIYICNMYIYYFSEGRNYLPKHAEAANPSLTEMPGLNRLSHSARFEAAIGKKKNHNYTFKQTSRSKERIRKPADEEEKSRRDPIDSDFRCTCGGDRKSTNKKNKKRNSNIP